VSKYVIVYLCGNQPSNPEEGKQHFSKYMNWLSSLGDSALSPANPLKNTITVNSDRVDIDFLELGGFHL